MPPQMSGAPKLIGWPYPLSTLAGGRALQILGKESLDGATSAWPEGWLSLGRLHLAWQALADLMDLSLPAAPAGA
eukprot:scaffold7219_cov84-Phaeocystis_antarctica.AAC.1